MSKNRKRVLIVDDEADVRQCVARLLRRRGIASYEACDGHEALSLARNSEDIGLVLLDIRMPRGDGMEVLEVLRTEMRSETPVVMLSAKDGICDVLGAYRKGADHYLPKPFDAKILVDVVCYYLDASEQEARPARSEMSGRMRWPNGRLPVPEAPMQESGLLYARARKTVEGKTVLVVDDEPDTQRCMARLLERRNIKVLLASDGSEVLELLRGGRQVDLILLDLRMPVTDGQKTLERLRAEGFDTPVIVVSALATGKSFMQCHRQGILYYLTKPFPTRAFECAIDYALADVSNEERQVLQNELTCLTEDY
ncbi:MAG: response regulator [Planctomycetota bacterium]|nr:response regulator [Planctomycetota bacterium]